MKYLQTQRNTLLRKKWIVLLSYVFILSFAHAPLASAQPAAIIKNSLADYFANYTNPRINTASPFRLTDVQTDDEQRCIWLYANAAFAEQPFTQETVAAIHRDISRLLPSPYNSYHITICANGTPIEELIPLEWSRNTAKSRTWGDLEYKGNPWVTPLSRPNEITKGLQGRHLSLWASHGRYYDFNKGVWKWQRPNLYCVTEDIFTQSFVVPFLIPMLENAGACVFTPRERDWQWEEAVVDNDAPSVKIGAANGSYIEFNGEHKWEDAGPGFKHAHFMYFDRENPFVDGTCRKVEAVSHKRQPSQAVWKPMLAHDGEYAVYVSYKTLPNSINDAEYTVWHRGIATKFRVNQQMGGGTWVYLGTFDFAAGSSQENCVTLSNHSSHHGVVVADGVRFGGGMGNISRGDTLHIHLLSGLPRHMEGSRYYAQWAGMPFSIYGNKEGTNDYAEDINTRSLMTNYLARGSSYLPGDSGLCVPLELSLAVHSDAGFSRENTNIGTLGIYTTGSNTPGEYEGLLHEGLLPSNRSRLMSRDLCDVVMTQVDEDIRAQYGTWNRRQMYDRNYSETRVPEIPSIILETMSHQNYADLLRGHDPSFKMLLSRAIYKGVLRYMSAVHGQNEYVVQPLPVGGFSATLTASGDSAVLKWHATEDVLTPSAKPTGYIVYTSVGEKGYDNGQLVHGNHIMVPIQRGKLTRFQVRAFNRGGCSLLSEELCVYAARQERHRLLIANGFHRLAGPQPVENDSLQGFDFNIDPGVVYRHSPSYCGRQYNMRKGIGEDFGQSGDELGGLLIAGNTFDYPTQHARDFLQADPTLSVSSCSLSALLSGDVLGGFHAIDLILGAQRQDGYSTNARPAFPPSVYPFLQNYVERGGSLLLSGAYISEEIDSQFANRVLHFTPNVPYFIDESSCQFSGMNTSFSIYYEPNEERFAVKRVSVLQPTVDAFTSVASQSLTTSLAVAYQGVSNRILTYGFPLECIREPETRKAVMAASLTFLLSNK